ncbi:MULTISPECIES: alpha/beta fold hydrolase [Sphingobium]|uniref:alpha/beta fold hydrolase n=1 Tax=Sphingobium TaxID=165695 RepID=UPI0015EC57CA|nr:MULTISPECIES: alpha/beta hydrolase [Sphingobium]MCW2364124.1 pimeloyl-ACP methyl ester carboxylesterase [Sphingobium sp. B10D3B]MCW2402479.1 pimeloyl-ACP methyl ester carboxylesterase [Sphingobium sp. B10D7B]MCW2409458.1 pimeloyl-ACP methyl ester carboxylesterase [Sphingobium xanthum]
MSGYEDKYWWSQDNLRLHYRDYPGREDRPPILCLPGLTRNVRDFEPVAERLAGEWRVIVVELRGRGESAYAKDPMSYVPLIYLQDLLKLIDELALPRFVGVGTSLGGIMLMLIAATRRGSLAGALLNDIGPEIAEEGLERIRQGVGTGSAQPTWVHAARAVADVQGVIYPDYKLTDWLRIAKRLYRLTSQGRIVLDYDQRLAEPFRAPGGAAGVDLWPAFEAIGDIPLTLVRGALSDLLTVQTAQAMQTRLPQLDLVTVPRVGHAPTLEEPEAVAALDRLLARISEKP